MSTNVTHEQHPEQDQQPRYIQLCKLPAKLDLNAATIRNFRKDPEKNFPQGMKISSKCVVFMEQEIDTWMRSHMAGGERAK